MPNFFSRLLSRGADKQLKEFRAITDRVGTLEPKFTAMDDSELKAQTALFRERNANGESLDDLLPEAFAAVREASRRTTGLRHFDVQVIGGIALHRGMIAEMKTGEGKTLGSTLAGYLNAIPGEGVHIVTVNDYLAKRDSEWMGEIYRYMGLNVGLLQNGMKLNLKKPAYAADVTYGTNSEFGFDYLRDNMVTRAAMRVQRGHHFAIVDEVDSILIDEARTPLIISGAGTKSASTYKDFARAVRGLIPDVDFEMDEAKHTIATTERGLTKVERALGVDDIYADMSGQLVNHLQQALKAFDAMRQREGAHIAEDFEQRLVKLEGMRQQLITLAPAIVEERRQHLQEVLAEALAGKDFDETRIIQETALFADRVNYTEEVVRLESHIAQFRQIMAAGEPSGRKLDFLIQEFNRETNTIGSKANSKDAAQLVVDMKSEIEKIREQVQNIE